MNDATYTKPCFPVPFQMMISGSPATGKTVWLAEVLRNRSELFDKQFDKIYFSYAAWQPIYDEIKSFLPEVEFVQGIMLDIFDHVDASSSRQTLYILGWLL